jgi:hypothetical protein
VFRSPGAGQYQFDRLFCVVVFRSPSALRRAPQVAHSAPSARPRDWGWDPPLLSSNGVNFSLAVSGKSSDFFVPREMNQKPDRPDLSKEWLKHYVLRLHEGGFPPDEIAHHINEWVLDLVGYTIWLQEEGANQSEITKVVNDAVDACDFDITKFPKSPKLFEMNLKTATLLGEKLDAYMRFRTTAEKVEYKFSPEFFRDGLLHGAKKFFGITWNEFQITDG